MRSIRPHRRLAAAVAVTTAALFSPAGGSAEPRMIPVTPLRLEAVVDSLQTAGGPLRDVTLTLAPGTYDLAPAAYLDATCGNCEEAATPVPATIGLRITGENVLLVGAGAGETILRTNAGYGLFFDGCRDCGLVGVTVTGGARDPDGRATDAAVVVRDGRVDIVGCEIRDNIGDPDVVREVTVGIIGICGREGSDVRLADTRIIRNSWDGIALYRDARGTVTGCVVDGIDAARGKDIGGGRGVGVGATWNAEVVATDNLVRNYWKGIGVFVDAHGEVRGNVLEDLLTWGIAVWDAGRGRPVAVVDGNVIRNVGACGISLAMPRDAGGSCTNNLVIGSGTNERYDDPDYYCTQCPIAARGLADGFVLSGNLCADNRRAVPDSVAAHDVCVDADGTEPWEALRRFVSLLGPGDVRRESATLSHRNGSARPRRRRRHPAPRPPRGGNDDGPSGVRAGRFDRRMIR